MKCSSCTMASIFILLVLTWKTQGIKLENKDYKGSDKQVFHRSAEVKAGLRTRGSGAALVLCRQNMKNCSGINNGGNGGRMPTIHEDYYGPGDHKSKHH